jgi:uncharacterized Ntn-hydrolase superfamily protein
MIVDGSVKPSAWQGRLMDLRIEDHPDPVPELRRLVTLQGAYDLLDDDSDAAEAGISEEERYAMSRRQAPDAYELVFWMGLEYAKRGDLERARQELSAAFAADRRWRTTLEHLAAARREGITPELAAQLLD